MSLLRASKQSTREFMGYNPFTSDKDKEKDRAGFGSKLGLGNLPNAHGESMSKGIAWFRSFAKKHPAVADAVMTGFQMAFPPAAPAIQAAKVALQVDAVTDKFTGENKETPEEMTQAGKELMQSEGSLQEKAGLFAKANPSLSLGEKAAQTNQQMQRRNRRKAGVLNPVGL